MPNSHVAAAHFQEQRQHEPGAGGADRMAQGDRAAVDVQPVGVDLARPASSRPRCSRRTSGDAIAFRHASTWAANASLISNRPMSDSASPVCRKQLVDREDRPEAHARRVEAGVGVAADVAEHRQALGGRHVGVGEKQAAAPSVIWQELPTVTVPSRRSKIGLSFASASMRLVRPRADVVTSPARTRSPA